MKKIISTMAVLSLFSLSSLSQATPLYKEDFSNAPASIWNETNMRWVKSSKQLRIDYNLYSNGGRTGSFPKIVRDVVFSRANEATLKYKINLDKNYTTNTGGKFFGLGPRKQVTGCRDITNNGWSARVGIRNKTPQLYIYDQSKSNGDCGEIIKASSPLKSNKWYDISLYVKLNSKGNKSDAQAILYVDGKEVARKTGFKFYDGTNRSAPVETKIQKLLLHTFLGSINNSKGGVKDSGTIRYDDFEVVRGKHP